MDVSFLTKTPAEGAKLLFEQSQHLTNDDLWNLFDFLLWQYHETNIDTLFTWYRELMSVGQGFKTAFITGHKFVCAATIKEGDPIYRCKTCQMDGTNLLCVACFKHSDHTGHDWTPTFTPGSGCCDCGDPESWDTKGFCSHHPGPNAGENINISENVERVSRLLCGYIVYILSHALSPNHYDVLYIDKHTATNSKYIQSSNSDKNKPQNSVKKPKPKKSASGGLFSGLFNFGGDDDDDEDEDEADTTMNDKDDMDVDHSSGIVARYDTFMKLLTESNTNHKDNDSVLVIKSREYKADGSDQTPGEQENCGLGWKHPKDVCFESIKCGTMDAMEIVWKLRMYNKCVIASGTVSYLETIANPWRSYSSIAPDNPPYVTEIIQPTTLTRIITKDLLLKIIKELRDWSNDSEILKRVIASCLMLNIDKLSAQCDGLVPIGKLSVVIPPFRDTTDVEMKGNEDTEVVTYEQTAIYHLILNDHVLEQDYNGPLIDLWFALVVIPAFKERVTQVFTSCYDKMMKFWAFISRQTQHCFVPLSVQFFTKKTTAHVCESHRLIETLFDTHLLQSCPKYVKAYSDYCEEHKVDSVDPLEIFDAVQMKANWSPHWMASKKSTHILYDIRYLLSIKDFMQYICFDSAYDPMDRFWKRLLHLLATYQHSKYQHRQCGREHIEMEDQTMVNVLRIDSTINAVNHRYLLHGLNVLFTTLKQQKDDDKVNKVLDMLLNVLFYGLSLIDKKPYDNFDFYFKDQMEDDDDDDDNEVNERIVRMKLNNFDGGYLECPYFRSDRDELTLTLNLSKTLCNIAKLYCDVSGRTFSELIKKLKDKFGETLNDDHIFHWMDLSLRFISAFNQFHSDLFRKNGSVFAMMIYNMEKPSFFSLFFSHNFYHIANNATDVFGASDFIILLFHRHLLYDWFCTENIELYCKHKHIKQEQLDALCDPLATGWKHWQDRNRVAKMVRNCLNELLAIISEPKYTLCLDNDDAEAKAVTRYELIQWLIFSKFTMSELESRVIMFGKVNRPDIRPILNDIAVYEAPQAMNAGKFRLKTEYYQEFNPYYRKYGKFNEYFGTADEQSEAIDNYIKTMKKKDNTKVMFPNWPYTTQLTTNAQIHLLTAPFMGLIWNSVLYHYYIEDKMRVHLTNFQQILRLISIAIQAMTEGRFDLNSDLGHKLIQNFVKHFKFRLTNEWDYIEDKNKDEIMKKYGTKKHMDADHDNDSNMKEMEHHKQDDNHHKQSGERYADVIGDNPSNGIGSTLWFLCKMVRDSKPKDEDSDEEKDKVPKITHIGPSQLLLIDKILNTLYGMNITALQTVMAPLWSPPSAHNDDKKKKKKTKKKAKLSPEEKRKRKAAKARAKAMKKMQQKKANFAEQNKDKIKKDAMREQLEEKQQKEAFGIGVKYQCIVCRSREKQDSMSMMAFAAKCCIMDRCINNNNKPFSTLNQQLFPQIEFYNKGLNFSFCGHCVHKSCYDTYIKQIQSAHNNAQHYAGRGSINILKKQFCCPYCKTVCNILVPLQVVYRNKSMKEKKYALMDKSKIAEREVNIEMVHRQRTVSFSTVIRRKLCDDFFKSIFCIWDRYAHSIKQHDNYIKLNGSTFAALSICNTLSYSIRCEEMNFRDLPANSRKDRLSRIASNINAFIAALWSLSNENTETAVFDRNIIKEFSWNIIEKKIWNENNNDSKENEDEEKYCYDPFNLLCRGIICYRTTFVFDNDQDNDSETLLMDIDTGQSNVRMDISDDEDKENERKKDEKDEMDTSAPELYKLLVSCYMMQISQLAISYCCNNSVNDANSMILPEIITTFIGNDTTKQELTQFIHMRIIPFLRKSCILYNSFGCIEGLDELWTSGIDGNMDELQTECDSLCDILYIPCIADVLVSILKDSNKYFANYINNMNKNEIDYIVEKIAFWDKCLPFSLIELPSSYNDLFQQAAFSTCRNTEIRPKYSAICLICGQYVCLGCCQSGAEKSATATRHCLECNSGFGAFLWLQKSKVLIIWNNLGVMFQSMYLDKYGEEDCGLVRGNRITLNTERYHQLCQIITQHRIPNKLVQLRKTNRDLLERHLAL